MTRYVLRRKEDGLYYRNQGPCYPRFGRLEEADIFRTKAAPIRSARPFLYEHRQRHRESLPWTPPKFHPEWFDEKFEVLEVSIRLKSDV